MVGYHQTNQKTDTGKTLKPWPVLVDHYNGTQKVLRGYIGGDSQYALTMFRQSSEPVPKIDKDDNYEKYGVGPQYVFRCVMNK